MTFPVLIADFLDLDIENGKLTFSIAVPPGYLREISWLCRLLSLPFASSSNLMINFEMFPLSSSIIPIVHLVLH